MKIMYEDLKFEAQMQLPDEADVGSPYERNLHIIPVAVVNFEKEVCNRHEISLDNEHPDFDP